MSKIFSLRSLLLVLGIAAVAFTGSAAAHAQQFNVTLYLANAVAYQNSGSAQGSAQSSNVTLNGSVSVAGVSSNGGSVNVICIDYVNGQYNGQVANYSAYSDGSHVISFTPIAGNHTVSCQGYFYGRQNSLVTTGTISFVSQ